jgi:PAS domain S-box-containing protein
MMFKYVKDKLADFKIQTSIILVFAGVFLSFIIINPKVFFSYHIYSSFMSTIPFMGIMVLALTPIIILGEMDLSFPSVLAVSAWVFAKVFVLTQNIFLALFAGLLMGLAAGLINSVLIVRFGIPSIVATLGTMFFWRGAVNVLSQGTGIPLLHVQDSIMYNVFVGRIAGIIPAQVIWFFLISIGFLLILKYHRFSTHILFSGNMRNNPGVTNKKIKLIKTIVFCQMSLFSALAGILLSLEVNSFWPNQGQGYLLTTLAAVFIGGASIFGGTGAILGSFIGAIVIGSLDAGVVAIGLTPFWIQLVYGIVIIISILLYNKDFNFKTIIENIMDNTTDNIYFKDRKSRFVLINAGYAKWLGLKDSSHAVGKTDDDFFRPKIAGRTKIEEDQILKTGQSVSLEVEEEIPGTKTTAWILTKKFPFYNDKGELIGTFGITRDITEKNMAAQREKEMQRKILAEREEAGRQKTTFFINLAHEIKTPLTLIKNYLEKYIAKKGMDEDIRIIKHNLDKMIRDIVNYMDAEKLSKEQIFYDHDQIICLSDILRNKIILFKNLAGDKRITLESQLEENVYIKADPYAIDRVINNLIDNAIKYTDSGGKIEITLSVLDGSVMIKVSDSGIGMTREQQKYIFKAFHQLSHAKRNIQGIGMGLYIVKKIVDSLDGKLIVESCPDRGTCFSVILHRHIISENDYILKNVLVSQPIQRGYGIQELKEENIQAGKPNILLVDDNAELLVFLQSSLKQKYNVFFAFNGRQALEKMKNIPAPDLIISDVMMDELDGHRFLKSLSVNDDFKHIPFIFLTVKDTINDKLKGLIEGAVDYIFKPFLIDEVMVKTENILKNTRILKDRNITQIGNKLEQFLRSNLEQDTQLSEYNHFEDICKKYNITCREKQVAELLSRGLLNKEISHKLNVSLSTVDFHIHNIYKKLNVQNKVELLNIIKS